MARKAATAMKTTTLEQEEEQARNAAETQGAAAAPAPDREQVARLAYRYWEERGRPDGTPEEDWFRAEQELRGRAA